MSNLDTLIKITKSVYGTDYLLFGGNLGLCVVHPDTGDDNVHRDYLTRENVGMFQELLQSGWIIEHIWDYETSVVMSLDNFIMAIKAERGLAVGMMNVVYAVLKPVKPDVVWLGTEFKNTWVMGFKVPVSEMTQLLLADTSGIEILNTWDVERPDGDYKMSAFIITSLSGVDEAED